ncbi:MAG: UDP-N-acetylglucosamine 2-epimerase (non-hydrolyzing) [Gammaproteobacteria bacterium]|nr:UDP-N-acetylglucosamine 2-epimerase (non-hydrolyzing) [Gammaproteobacteria bacterium]
MTSANQHNVLFVVGARPNFMKIAPLMRVISQQQTGIHPFLVHTGQHYGPDMQSSFFDQLDIPEPDIDLEVGSASHAVQTAEIMKRFESVLDQDTYSAVVVVGDVNSTIACGLVAVKKHIPLVHVESGLRCYDRGMPEEINRVLTDQISDLLFTTERSAHDNLAKEGIDSQKIHFVGNVMVDTLLSNIERSVPYDQTINKFTNDECHISEKDYAVLTLHRPATVDNPARLKDIIQTIINVSTKIPVIFPVHPRTEKQIQQQQLEILFNTSNVIRLPALGYLEILGLLKSARFVMTDSGGLQEETTALGIPCLTLRPSTERPITVSEGTNTIVDLNADKIYSGVNDILETGGKSGCIPEYWDGKAAERIVSILDQWL